MDDSKTKVKKKKVSTKKSKLNAKIKEILKSKPKHHDGALLKNLEPLKVSSIAKNINTTPTDNYPDSQGSNILCLAVIKEIQPQRLLLDLPNNIVGIASYSMCGIQENESGVDGRNALESFFCVGDAIVVRIVKVDYKQKRSKRAVILCETGVRSIYRDLRKSELSPGLVLLGSISSKEDHGYVVSLGLEGVSGFLNFRDTDPSIPQEKPNKYQWVTIDKIRGSTKDENSHVVLSFSSKKGLTNPVNPGAVSNISCIKPGFLVEAVIKQVVTHRVSRKSIGLIVEFLDFFSGVIDAFNLPKPVTSFKVNEKIMARVIFVDEGSSMIRLSASEFLVEKFRPYCTDDLNNVLSLFQGGIYNSTVTEKRFITPATGLDLIITTEEGREISARADKKNLSDPGVILDHSQYFAADSTHECKVMGYNLMYGFAKVTLQPSLIARSVSKLADLSVTNSYKATIIKVIPEGVIVSMENNSNVTGLIPRIHLADVPIQKPESKFKEGQTLEVRVLVVAPQQKKLILTHKNTLLRSSLPKFASYEDCQPNLQSHGVITGVGQFGCIVTFYNDVHGIVPVKELSDLGNITAPEKHFQVGQVCKARVIQCQPEKGKLTLTFKVSKGGTTSSTPDQPEIPPVENHSYKSIESVTNFKVGMIVECKITSIASSQINVSLSQHIRGRIHITEITDHPSDQHPLSNFKVGDSLKARVIDIIEKASNKFLPLSHSNPVTRRLIELSLKHIQSPQMPPRITLASLNKGDRVTGVVQTVLKDGLWVHITGSLRGRVFLLDISENIEELMDVKKVYPPGTVVSCTVSMVNLEKQSLDLTIKPPTRIEPGKILVGRVSKVTPLALNMQLGSHTYGRIFVTDIQDRHRHFPTAGFRQGDIFKVAVVKVDKHHGFIDLSTKGSDLGTESEEDKKYLERFPYPSSNSEVNEGQIVRGYVKEISSKYGCTIALSRTVSGKVSLWDLCDYRVKDPEKKFPPGSVVTARVLTNDQQFLKLATKSSAVSSGLLDINTISEGDIVQGTVISVVPYAVYVRIKNSKNLTGMCHRTEIVQGALINDLHKLFCVNDQVLARVMSVDKENFRILLSMNKEYFENFEEEDDESFYSIEPPTPEEVENALSQFQEGNNLEIPEEQQGDDQGETKNKEQDEEVENDEVQEEIFEENDEVQEENGEENGEENDEENEEQEEENENEIKLKVSGKRQRELDSDENKAKKKKTEVSTLFGYELYSLLKGTPEQLGINPGTSYETPNQEWPEFSFSIKGSDSSGTGSLHGNDDDDDSEEKGSSKERKKQRLAKNKEIQEEEEKLVHQSRPETPDDFERLLLGSPNSSYIWINYIAYYLALSEIDKAREVANRALKKINYREYKEKEKVWIVWLKFEHDYGTNDTLMKTFAQAQQFNDPKKMHFQLLQIYLDSQEYEFALEILQKMIEKFKTSSKVWEAYAKFKLDHPKISGKLELTTPILDRALQSLPKRKHITFISKLGQLEFKFGTPEKGRTFFEGIVNNYPKRIDIWSIYIDLEIKQTNNLSRTRNLFERVTNLPLSTKKMKAMLKKYYLFEKAYGTEETQQKVKSKAETYIDAKLSKNE